VRPKKFLQIARTRFLSIKFDREDLPDGDKVLQLVADLRSMSAGVVVSSGGYLRASYNTRPFKEMTLASVRSYLRRSPMADVLVFVDKLQPGLAAEGFAKAEEKTLELISSLLKLAAKSAEPFLLLLHDFLCSPQQPAATAAAVALLEEEVAAVAVEVDNDDAEEEEEDYCNSPPGLWRPPLY
jgi:hypothetical protein